MTKNILIVLNFALITLYGLIPQHSQATQSDVPKELFITRFAYQEANNQLPYDSLEQGEEFPDMPFTQESKSTEIGNLSEERQGINFEIKVNPPDHIGDTNTENILESVYKDILTQRLHKKNIEQTRYYPPYANDLRPGYFTPHKILLNSINVENKIQYSKSYPKQNKPKSKKKPTRNNL